MASLSQLLQVTKVPFMVACAAVLGCAVALKAEGAWGLAPWHFIVFWGAGAVLALGVAYWQRYTVYAAWACAAVFGCFYAGWTHYALWQHYPPPLLEERLEEGRHWVQGTVEKITLRDTGRAVVEVRNARVFLKPEPVRVSAVRFTAYPSQVAELVSGAGVSAQLKLKLPSVPEFEGGFDGVRYARFYGAQLSGYVYGSVYASSLPDDLREPLWMKHYWHLRQHLIDAIDTRTTGESGALLQAFITGERTGLSYAVKDAFRDTGLSHLLAISGWHVGMVAGLFYFILRRLLVWHPRVIHAVDSKRLAAFPALLMTVLYTLVAGASIPTVRTCVVLCLLFTAVMLNRFTNTFRILCVCVCVVLFFWPVSVESPSFQMSFAAAFALMMFTWQTHAQTEGKTQRWWHMSMGYFSGIIIATVVAGFATMPIAAWHFQNANLSGLISNLVAIPLLGFWVLPVALLAVLLMPFGLDTPFWTVADWGAQTMILWATELAKMPGSGMFMPRETWLGMMLLIGVAFVALGKNKRPVAYVALVACSVWVAASPYLTAIKTPLVLHDGTVTLLPYQGRKMLLAQEDLSKKAQQRLSTFLHTQHVTLHTPEPHEKSCDVSGCVLQTPRGQYAILKEGFYADAEDKRQNHALFECAREDKDLRCLPAAVAFP